MNIWLALILNETKLPYFKQNLLFTILQIFAYFLKYLNKFKLEFKIKIKKWAENRKTGQKSDLSQTKAFFTIYKGYIYYSL